MVSVMTKPSSLDACENTKPLMPIRFNQPYMVGPEAEHVQASLASGKLCGDGAFTHRCQEYFEQSFGFNKALLATSCTDALEMAAILMNIQPGDEVIMPSYTFVSTANAFLLRGAKIVFADTERDVPNIDIATLESLITPKTKGIVVVHYAGMACDMAALMPIVKKHNLMLIEDAAHSIDAYYLGEDGSRTPLGRFGQLSTFSFHETKNIICGEGGLLAINDPAFQARAEVIREKGTNRAAFFRGEVDKYNWRDIGSSFLPADYVAAFLWGQLENLRLIQDKRLNVWNTYYKALKPLEDAGKVALQKIPAYSEHNAHLFYMVCDSLEQRTALMSFLKDRGIQTTFHYVPLHESPCYLSQPEHMRAEARELPNTKRFAECLVRLPLHGHLSEADMARVTDAVIEFYNA